MKKKEFDADLFALGMFGICLAVLAIYAITQGSSGSRKLATVDEPSQADCEPYGLTAPYPEVPLEKVPTEVIFNYRQNELKLVDPVSDFALGVTAKDVPQNVGRMLRRDHVGMEEHRQKIRKAERCAIWFFGLDPQAYLSPYGEPRGGSWPEDVAFIEAMDISEERKKEILELIETREIQVEDRKRPILNKGLVRAYLTVIRQEHERDGLVPTVGEIHAWSPEFKQKYAKRFRPYSLLSKPLMSLWRGVTGRTMATGQERNLESWILQQPDNSITLPEMFRASYRLNAGNVYLTLLTIENLLAKDWSTPNRQSLVKTRKLTRIVHAIGNLDDRFGTWYHLFGVTFYGYVSGGLQAWVVGETEALGSQLIARFGAEFQENSINRNGGFVGARLKRAIEKGLWRDQKGDGALDADEYLNPNNRLEKKINKALKKREARLAKPDENSGS